MSAAELRALAERCERAEGPDREIDREIGGTLRIAPLHKLRGRISASWPDYTASVDAALLLVPPPSEWNIYSPDLDAGETKFSCEIAPTVAAWKAGRGAVAAYALTPALALCAASLKALAEQESP